MMKHFSKGMYTLFLSLILVLVAGVSQAAAANLLRVLVKEENSSKMSVAVTQPATLQISGQASRRLDPGKWYTLPLTSAYRITPSNNGLVQVGNTLYPGEIELRAWNNKAIAVNVLSLEEYLRSVVPSEMPASWHMDALMAQAVAARSYAVNTQRQRKWGEAPYDLVSDTRDQVYKGFYRYDPQTGQAIGFKGYYRARLPRNWISWGGGYMPVSDGQHLDQEMTQQMAQNGWNWVQILSWWYRDQPIKN